jgi:hypothetical protein
VAGLIEHLGLSRWWIETFTDDERLTILERVDRPFSAYANMDSGEVSYSSFTRAVFLCGLTGWFTRSDLRDIGRKIAISAEDWLGEIQNPVDLHFALANLIDFWERTGGHRNQNIDRELPLCRRQVAIADTVAPLLKAQFNDPQLPLHTGFRRLFELLDPDCDGAEISLLKGAVERSNWRVN